MSSKAEMSSGLTNGVLQGYKSGLGFSRMESGFKKGLLNGIRDHNKVQDPTVGLIADKIPTLFWVADYTRTGGVYPPTPNSTIGSTDGPFELIGGSLMVAGSNPVFRKGVLNEKGYVDFSTSADRISSPTTTTGTSEFTVCMVLRLSSILTGVLLQRISTGSTVGDIQITSIGGTKIRVSFIGSPTTTSSVYETYEPTIATTETISNGTNTNKWFILTVKFDLTQRNGNGSEMEIYIDGVKNMTPITTTFTGTTAATMPNVSIHFGNTTTSSNDVNYRCQIASAVVFNYWLSNSEQMRIENFYRYYYGHRF